MLPSVVSIVAIVASVVLAVDQSLLSSVWVRHGIGWVAGAIVPVLALVWQRGKLRSLRARPDFYSTRFRNWAMVVLLFVGLGVGLWNASQVAAWYAS